MFRTLSRRTLVGMLIFAAVGLPSCSSTSATKSSTPQSTTTLTSPGPATSKSTVFSSGEDGIDTYRIPSMVISAKGTIVVAAEARTLSPLDTDPHHLVAKRSTDGGRTWSKLIQVAPQDTPQKGCYPSDPVLSAPTQGKGAGDLVVVFHPCRNGGGLYASRSTNDGVTWSAMAPLNLKPVAGLTADQIDKLRSGPGNGIVLRSGPNTGRLAMVADTGLMGGPATVAVLLSDDGGNTWHVGAHATVPANAKFNVDESAIAQTGAGTIVVSSRDSGAGGTDRIQMDVSPNGENVIPGPDGATLRSTGDLGLPGVQGSLLGLTHPQELVLASPSDPKSRRGLRLFTSTDGTSWAQGPVPVPGPAAYSGMVSLDASTIGLVVETGKGNPYERIEFLPIRVSTLKEKGTLPANTASPSSAASGRFVVDGTRYPVTGFCLVAPKIDLRGGSIAINLKKGLGAVEVNATINASGGHKALKLTGSVAVDMSAGIVYRGPLKDASGKTHTVDLVIVNSLPCK